MKAIADLNRLLVAIERAGLGDLAKEKSAYAFETAWRISEKKADLANSWPLDDELVKAFEDDTAETARVLSNPVNWGISDERWKEFCKEWKC